MRCDGRPQMRVCAYGRHCWRAARLGRTWPRYRRAVTAMQCRRSVACGLAVLAVVLALAALTFLLSQTHGACAEGTFPCGNSSICLPQRFICNGHIDCPNGEDESKYTCTDVHGSNFNQDIVINRNYSQAFNDCQLESLPRGCLCRDKTWVFCRELGLTHVPQDISTNVTRLILSNNSITLSQDSFKKYHNLELIHLGWNQISDIPNGMFKGQRTLRRLFLSKNSLTELRPGVLQDLPHLSWLVLQDNCISDIDLDTFQYLNLTWLDMTRNNLTLKGKIFPDLPELKQLILEDNTIETIGEFTLANLKALQALDLTKNRIRYIHPKAFANLWNLEELELSGNQLVSLSSSVFYNLTFLMKLSLSNNPFRLLPTQLFRRLENLRSLGLVDTDIQNIDVELFAHCPKLEFLYFSKFYYCTYAPAVRICRPNTDGVSSLKHLLVKPALRVTVWVVAAVTCAGNALVLWGRFSSRDENRVHSLVIRNLADLLMGVYLLVIGTQDCQFRDRYHKEAHSWMTSWKCTVVGMVAMTSSEVSVLILVFLSMERFLLIAVPFGGHQNMSMRTTCLSLAVIWFIGVCLAAVPVMYWINSTRFYGTNGMCFPLHIDDPFLLGWEYSAFIFLGVNFSSLLLIAVLYAWMFVSIWRTRHATPISSVGDFEFVIRFFFIVLTDAGCWAPIFALKLVALSRVHIPADLYAWVVVFILPVNSAVNPLLYTFTTPKYRGQLCQLGCQAHSLATKRHSSADTELSRSSTNRNAVDRRADNGLYAMLPARDPAHT
ncbi:relaxin receptor 2-like isoform X2 [Periplaneta americana]|uniref:relaxin receptor 2-like isoform X2 n=1 Tax=Periplaneta americana TaxID=6978 RepID=UPI0037E7D3C6